MSYQCPTCGKWASCWSPRIFNFPEKPEPKTTVLEDLLAPKPPAAQQAEGMAMVPRVPTQAMIDAVMPTEPGFGKPMTAKQIWQAMLAAAPQTTEGE